LINPYEIAVKPGAVFANAISASSGVSFSAISPGLQIRLYNLKMIHTFHAAVNLITWRHRPVLLHPEDLHDQISITLQQHSDVMTTTGEKRRAEFGAIKIRKANQNDLDKINDVVATAIDTWNLTARVKRISLPLYRYQRHDLNHLQIMVAERDDDCILGIAALEQTGTSGLPHEGSSSTLQGLYVDPDHHRMGIGSLLLQSIEEIAVATEAEGLLVKAQAEAISFFKGHGFKLLPVEDNSRDYPYRLWKTL
jgi:GNAT superfamily N-acetyltransferase